MKNILASSLVKTVSERIMRNKNKCQDYHQLYIRSIPDTIVNLHIGDGLVIGLNLEAISLHIQ